MLQEMRHKHFWPLVGKVKGRTVDQDRRARARNKTPIRHRDREGAEVGNDGDEGIEKNGNTTNELTSVTIGNARTTDATSATRRRNLDMTRYSEPQNSTLQRSA